MNTACICIQTYPTTEPLWQAGRRGPLGILPGAIPEVLGLPQLEASQKFISRVITVITQRNGGHRRRLHHPRSRRYRHRPLRRTSRLPLPLRPLPVSLPPFAYILTLTPLFQNVNIPPLPPPPRRKGLRTPWHHLPDLYSRGFPAGYAQCSLRSSHP